MPAFRLAGGKQTGTPPHHLDCYRGARSLSSMSGNFMRVRLRGGVVVFFGMR